jgi:ankyrin repeat protein
VIEELYKARVDLTAYDAHGCAPAHFAAIDGHVNVLAALHKFHLNLAARSADGYAPVHFAAARGHGHVIEALQRFEGPGATRLTGPDAHGQMPDELARAAGHSELANQLTGLRPRTPSPRLPATQTFGLSH